MPLKAVLNEKMRQLLQSAREISILSHTNPDGDAMGSALALHHYLQMKGKETHVIVPTDYPDFLGWMPGAEDVAVYENDEELCRRYLRESDLLVCVDFNTPDRLEGVQEVFENSAAPKLLIDHHVDKGHFCDHAYKTTDVSSTSELIFYLLDDLGDSDALNHDIATCLYVGIMTDTGSFSYACNSAYTFRAVAELMKTGIDGENIHRLVYDTYSEERIRLLGFCLSEKLIVLDDYNTAFIALSQEELDRFQYRNGDTEGVVNYTLGIKGIVFGALITQRKDKIKISLRSKGNFDVNKLAAAHFNGGGHKNASGGDLYCSFEEAVSLFRSVLPMYKKELNEA